METRANNILIGAFVLVGFALALVLAVWIARNGDSGPKKQFFVVFSGSVQGLSVGAAVLFNGLRVGDVNDIRINPGNTTEVRARITVDALTPVRRDARVRLTYTGLTGAAAIEITGGTMQAGDLVPGADAVPPALFAERSFVQGIIEGGQDTLGRINGIVDRVEEIVRTNQPAIGTIFRNLETFSDAVARNSDAVSTLLSDSSIAARRIADLSARVEAIAAGIEPQRVRDVIDGTATLVTALADQRDAIASAIADTSRAARNVSEATERIVPTFRRMEELANAIDPAAIGRSVASFDRAATALADGLDPARLQEIVEGAAAVVRALAAQRGEIGTFVSDAARAARNVSEATERLAPTMRRVDELVAAVDAAAIGRAISNAERATGALAEGLDPARLREIVDGSASIVQALSAQREEIRTLVADASRAARGVADGAGRLEPVLRRAEEVLGAIDPAALGRSVAGVERFATALGTESARLPRLGEDVGELVASLRRSASALEGFAGAIGGQGGGGTGLAGVGGVIEEFTQTARSIRTTSDNLDRRLAAISGNLDRFTGTGLRDLQSLIVDGRRSLANMDRVLRDLERNPQQFIFGRSGVPEFRR